MQWELSYCGVFRLSHADWAEEFAARRDITPENVNDVIKDEIGKVSTPFIGQKQEERNGNRKMFHFPFICTSIKLFIFLF